MDKRTCERRLKALGFEIDWTVTGYNGMVWFGTIDPIGKFTFEPGGCQGLTCSGMTAPEMYEEMVKEAKAHADLLEPCNDPECDMHGEEPEQ